MEDAITWSKKMGNFSAYLILILAVILGTASNGFAKSAQGFTVLVPSILTAIYCRMYVHAFSGYEIFTCWNYLCLFCRSVYSCHIISWHL